MMCPAYDRRWRMTDTIQVDRVPFPREQYCDACKETVTDTAMFRLWIGTGQQIMLKLCRDCKGCLKRQLDIAEFKELLT